MQNYYQCLVPRLNGDDIARDFKKHLSLVKKGIGGFIVFGGRLKQTRTFIRQLQEESALPLIIASDLERGLGQQLKGGTSFPPAMALARAAMGKGPGESIPGQRLKLLRASFRAVAEEARYAGINTVLAPVLDINTNPDNPIIGVRSFGEDSDTVSFFGSEMIHVLQENGLAACGKHFPGHGDTLVDSHLGLPLLGRSLRSLRRTELRPFLRAISEGVAMIMLSHMSVPALDPSGLPVSLSRPAVSYIRKSLGYDGILITDAMNMGGLSRFSEEESSFSALTAGVDIILHPTDADCVAAYFRKKGAVLYNSRLVGFRKGLMRFPDETRPPFKGHGLLSDDLVRTAISLSPAFRISHSPLLVILSDEKQRQGDILLRLLRQEIPGIETVRCAGPDQKTGIMRKVAGAGKDRQVIVAVFSETRAWKGDQGKWLPGLIRELAGRAGLFISFGNPYLLRDIPRKNKMLTYWNSAQAQRAAAGVLLARFRP